MDLLYCILTGRDVIKPGYPLEYFTWGDSTYIFYGEMSGWPQPLVMEASKREKVMVSLRSL